MFGKSVSLRLLFAAAFLIVALVVVPKLRTLSAQEATATVTPSETATLTATWTETATLVPSDTATATLTETATDTATATPTEMPTTTAAVTDTATPTLEAVAPASPTATLVETPSATATSDTATPSPTLTASTTATIHAARAFSSIDSGLNLLYSQSFDGTTDPYDELYGFPWPFVEHAPDLALQITTDSQTTRVTMSQTPNRAIQASFFIAAGAAKLMVRQSGSGNYSATLGVDGLVSLYRNEQQISTTLLSTFSSGDWHTFQLSAIGNVLQVFVDDIEVINQTDPAPLTPGVVSFSAVNSAGNPLLVDDIYVWAVIEPLPEMPNSALSASSASRSASFFGGNDSLGYTNKLNESVRIIGVTAGGNQTIQLPTEVFGAYDIEWSPNGQIAVFSCQIDYGISPNRYGLDICKINANGSNYINLTRPSNLSDQSLRLHGERNPSFSPDGSKIVFNAYNRPDGLYGLWIKDLNTLVETRLNFLDTGGPAWGPNHIFFRYSDGIYRVSPQGGTPTAVILHNNTQLINSLPAPLIFGSLGVDYPAINSRGDLAFQVGYDDRIGIGVMVNANAQVIRPFCATDPDFAPYSDALAVVSPGAEYQCPDVQGDVIIIDKNGNVLRQYLTNIGDNGIGFDWHTQPSNQATATPISIANQTATAQAIILATASAQAATATRGAHLTATANANATATARATQTVTVTPRPNCAIAPPLENNFLAAGGLLVHDVVLGGHAYFRHVVVPPQLVFERARFVSASTAFWDSVMGIGAGNARADKVVGRWLESAPILVSWSTTAVDQEPYVFYGLAGVNVISPLTTVNTFTVLNYHFVNTTGYGFQDVLGTIRPYYPTGAIVWLKCNVYSPLANVPYTINSAYPN